MKHKYYHTSDFAPPKFFVPQPSPEHRRTPRALHPAVFFPAWFFGGEPGARVPALRNQEPQVERHVSHRPPNRLC